MSKLSNQQSNLKILARINEDGTKEVAVKRLNSPKLNADKLRIFLYDYCEKKTVDKHIKMWISTLESMWRAEQMENSVMTLDYISQKYEVVVDENGQLEMVKVSDGYQRKFIEFLKEECNQELLLTNKEWEQLLEQLDGEILKPENEPDFIPNGFNHLDGNILEGDYRIADDSGNIFLWVPEHTIHGKIIKGHYWSAYPVTKDYRIAKPDTKSSEYIKGVKYDTVKDTILEKVSTNLGEKIIVSLGTCDEYDSFCEQVISVMGEDGESGTNYCGGLNFYTRVEDREFCNDEDCYGWFNYVRGGLKFKDLRDCKWENDFFALDEGIGADRFYNAVIRVVIRQQ